MERIKTLLAVPSPMEWKVLYPKEPFGKTVERPLKLNSRFDAACLGIGLVNFGGHLAKLLLRREYFRVIVVGIAGALPGSGLSLADTVRVDEECVGDEGYLHSDTFKPYFRRPNLLRASSFRKAPPQIAALSGVRGVSVNTLTASSQILDCRASFLAQKSRRWKALPLLPLQTRCMSRCLKFARSAILRETWTNRNGTCVIRSAALPGTFSNR